MSERICGECKHAGEVKHSQQYMCDADVPPWALEHHDCRWPGAWVSFDDRQANVCPCFEPREVAP